MRRSSRLNKNLHDSDENEITTNDVAMFHRAGQARLRNMIAAANAAATADDTLDPTTSPPDLPLASKPSPPTSSASSRPPESPPPARSGAPSSHALPPAQVQHVPSEIELKLKRLRELIRGLPGQLAEASKFDFNLVDVDTSSPDDDERGPSEIYHDVLQRMFGMRATAAKSTEGSRQAAFELSKAAPDNGSISPSTSSQIAQATVCDGSVLWGRGPHAEHLVEGFEKALKTCPGDAIILKWLDDVTNMAKASYEFFNKQVSTSWLCSRWSSNCLWLYRSQNTPFSSHLSSIKPLMKKVAGAQMNMKLATITMVTATATVAPTKSCQILILHLRDKRSIHATVRMPKYNNFPNLPRQTCRILRSMDARWIVMRGIILTAFCACERSSLSMRHRNWGRRRPCLTAWLLVSMALVLPIHGTDSRSSLVKRIRNLWKCVRKLHFYQCPFSDPFSSVLQPSPIGIRQSSHQLIRKRWLIWKQTKVLKSSRRHVCRYISIISKQRPRHMSRKAIEAR